MCPQCDGTVLLREDYEIREESTGYRDRGSIYTCLTCGAESAEDEVAASNAE